MKKSLVVLSILALMVVGCTKTKNEVKSEPKITITTEKNTEKAVTEEGITVITNAAVKIEVISPTATTSAALTTSAAVK